MRTILLFLSVIFVSSLLNAQGWKPKVSGTQNNLLSVSLVDNNIGYISGSLGTILKTTDGGDIWTKQNSGIDQDLFEISFINADKGFAVGTGNNVLSTKDGGETWNVLNISGTDFSFYYRNIWFLNDNVGFITGGQAGNQGVILKTLDAGNTWTKLEPNSGSAIYGIFFTSPTTGYYSNFQGEIKKTENGGETWNLLSSGVTTTVYALHFTSNLEGYACGEKGVLLKTTDAGETWNLLNSNTTDVFTDMAFLDEYVGFAVGGNVANNTSTILKTSDGGESWTSETITSTRQYGCEFLSFEAGFSVGLNGSILKVTNISAADQKIKVNTNSIKTYPNPTSKYLTLECDSLQKYFGQKIEILNCLGKIIYAETINKQKSFIDLSTLGGSGIYYIHVADHKNTSEVIKIILL